MDTYLFTTVAIILIAILVYLSYLQYIRKHEAKQQLRVDGYDLLFCGDGDNFIAFNLRSGFARIGCLLPYSHTDLQISHIHNYEWKWIERNAQKVSNKFVFYISDVTYPMHEILYSDREREAEYDWAKVQAVFSRAVAAQYEQGSAIDRHGQYDFFVSHASEDKDTFVRPLVGCLEALGLSVWYDEFTLEVGDSLRRSIDLGLASSKYGIVVLSKSFFSKQWPQYELDGLTTKSIGGTGGKVILPIWYDVSHDDVANYSLSLADKVAFSSARLTVGQMAEQFLKVVQEND
jgi:TIR domain